MRLLVFLIMPIIASADEPVDLIAALEEAAATPKTYHAMCAAAYALLAADASGNRASSSAVWVTVNRDRCAAGSLNGLRCHG